MNTEPGDIQSILSRIVALERDNRRMKMTSAIVLLVAVAVVTMGQARPNRTIEGEKFVLRDSNGAIRAELGIISGGFPSLRFFDSDGTFRSTISSELLSFINGQVVRSKYKDSSDLSKGVDNEYVDGPMVTLSQSSLIVMENVKGNGTRQVFAHLYWVPGPGSPSLMLQSTPANGRPSILEMTAAADGPYFSIKDSQGFSSVFGSSSLITPHTGETHKTSAASVVLFDKDRNMIWAAPAPR